MGATGGWFEPPVSSLISSRESNSTGERRRTPVALVVPGDDLDFSSISCFRINGALRVCLSDRREASVASNQP